MSRQQHTQRDRKTDGHKTDAASNAGRYSRNERDQRQDAPRHREETRNINGLNRYTLNDLYERSSI